MKRFVVFSFLAGVSAMRMDGAAGTSSRIKAHRAEIAEKQAKSKVVRNRIDEEQTLNISFTPHGDHISIIAPESPQQAKSKVVVTNRMDEVQKFESELNALIKKYPIVKKFADQCKEQRYIAMNVNTIMSAVISIPHTKYYPKLFRKFVFEKSNFPYPKLMDGESESYDILPKVVKLLTKYGHDINAGTAVVFSLVLNNITDATTIHASHFLTLFHFNDEIAIIILFFDKCKQLAVAQIE